jgi:hypothetical protein
MGADVTAPQSALAYGREIIDDSLRRLIRDSRNGDGRCIYFQFSIIRQHGPTHTQIYFHFMTRQRNLLQMCICRSLNISYGPVS